MAVDVVSQSGVARDGGIGSVIQGGTQALSANYFSQGVDAYGRAFVTTEGSKPTYSAVSVGLVPAASATDVFTILAGSKTVRILRWAISGTAGTAILTPVIIFKRSAASTGGTPATGNALPLAFVGHDSSVNPTSTATLNAYTANPTVVGTVNTVANYPVRAGFVSLPVTTGGAQPLVFDWSTRNGQGLVLRPGQFAAMHLNAVTVSTGALAIEIEFTEE